MARSSRSGFEEFTIAATPSLLRSAYLLTGDQHLAEDLVQDALARTYRAWHRLEREDNAQAYARKTMYHLRVGFWRRRRVRESFGDEPRDSPTADATPDVDLRMSLRVAMRKLSARQRAVIVLRYFEDNTVTETARILGCGEGTVKTQAFRALNKLRTELPDLVELVNGAS